MVITEAGTKLAGVKNFQNIDAWKRAAKVYEKISNQFEIDLTGYTTHLAEIHAAPERTCATLGRIAGTPLIPQDPLTAGFDRTRTPIQLLAKIGCRNVLIVA